MMLGQTVGPTITAPVAAAQPFVSPYTPSQIATDCTGSGVFLKDPAGNLISRSIMFPAGAAVGGLLLLMNDHPIIGTALLAFGFLNLSLFNCSQVPPGNECTGYTECSTFLCRNGGCGF